MVRLEHGHINAIFLESCRQRLHHASDGAVRNAGILHTLRCLAQTTLRLEVQEARIRVTISAVATILHETLYSGFVDITQDLAITLLLRSRPQDLIEQSVVVKWKVGQCFINKLYQSQVPKAMVRGESAGAALSLYVFWEGLQFAFDKQAARGEKIHVEPFNREFFKSRLCSAA